MFDNTLQSTAVNASQPYTVVDYLSFNAYLEGMKTCNMLFMPNCPELILTRTLLFTRHARIHRFNDHVCIGFKTLIPSDLLLLQSICGSVLIRSITTNVVDYSLDNSPLEQIVAHGFQVFFEHGNTNAQLSTLRRYRLIGLAEFGISSAARLAAYPAISHGISYGMNEGNDGKPIRTVFILDLIQDFEVLQPLILRCVVSYPWRDLIISVSDRVIKSHTWVYVKPFIESLGIAWFKPIGPLDTVNALGESKSVLITASESTANGHVFCHTVCRLAPKRTIKITLQHGYECVGLRHHQAHDLQFPQGVRFASDFVLTWSNPELLSNIHPFDRNKCIPVGVIKNFAEDVAVTRLVEKRNNPALASAGGHQVSLLVAENLHSVRFLNAQRYQRFLNFMNEASYGIGYALTVRSHPGKRTLELNKNKHDFAFLEGMLRAGDLARFDFFVSPPSTIVLDAVLAGVPTALWSDRKELGDCENYAAIPSVCELEELDQLCRNSNVMEKIRMDNYQWAAQNICAFNGVPQAWSKMNELING
jgi:hypothetical protein